MTVRTPWSPEEDAELVRIHDLGGDSTEAGHKLKRSPRSCDERYGIVYGSSVRDGGATRPLRANDNAHVLAALASGSFRADWSKP